MAARTGAGSRIGVKLASPQIVNRAVWRRPLPATTVEAMATAVQHPDRPIRPYHRVPWSARAWSQALYLAGGIPAQLVPLLLVVLSACLLYTSDAADE